MREVPPIFHEYVAGLKAHDVPRIAATMGDDLQVIGATRTLGKPEFVPFLHALYTAFPDWNYDHDPIEWHDDLLAIKWRQSGTHTATLVFPGMAPIAATGRRVRIPDQYFRYRVANDRLVLIHPDPIPGGAPRGILEQIGAVEPPL